MRIRWHGTASVEMESAGCTVHFDPFVPLPGSPVPVQISDYDGVKTIFVTHGHLDHIASIPEIYKRNPNVVIHCTDTPYKTLLKKGVPEANLVKIAYGSVTEIGPFHITAYHGKHAILPKATPKRIASILFSRNAQNIPYLLRENRSCPENGETVFYQIEVEGKTISLMGSLNIRDDISYSTGADLLILPYNGWEDNLAPAVKVIETLSPKRIMLDHYDDTFPPLTALVDTSPILQKYLDRCSAMEWNCWYTV